MVFRVSISPQALSDLDGIAEYLKIEASTAIAEQWFNDIISAIRTLSKMPSRCFPAEEPAGLRAPVRVLLFGSRNRQYKIYFTINEPARLVEVLHVRHWARKPAAPGDWPVKDPQ